jgi:hypothetical protein
VSVPFIRLSDNYIDNPKIVALSEGSFCLWHEGMAYARKHQTDGIITFHAMRAFRFYTKGREKQLATPYTDGANPLWALIPATGYKIHDYLDWNLSREEEQSERTATAARVRRFRQHRNGVSNGVTSTVTEPLRNADVPDRIGEGKGFGISERGSGGKPSGSKRPIYQSDRFVVFEWQLGELSRMLGPHVDEFDLHGFFDDLSRQSREQGLVIPLDREKRWKWLQTQVELAARTRGLPMAGAMNAEEAELAALIRKGPSVRP